MWNLPLFFSYKGDNFYLESNLIDFLILKHYLFPQSQITTIDR